MAEPREWQTSGSGFYTLAVFWIKTKYPKFEMLQKKLLWLVTFRVYHIKKNYFKVELEMHASFLNTEMGCPPYIFTCTKFSLIPEDFWKCSQKRQEETVTVWRSLRNGVVILNALHIYGPWVLSAVLQYIMTNRIKCHLSLGILWT